MPRQLLRRFFPRIAPLAALVAMVVVALGLGGVVRAASPLPEITRASAQALCERPDGAWWGTRWVFSPTTPVLWLSPTGPRGAWEGSVYWPRPGFTDMRPAFLAGEPTLARTLVCIHPWEVIFDDFAKGRSSSEYGIEARIVDAASGAVVGVLETRGAPARATPGAELETWLRVYGMPRAGP